MKKTTGPKACWRIRCERVHGGQAYEYIVGEYRHFWIARVLLFFMYLGPYDAAWLEERVQRDCHSLV